MDADYLLLLSAIENKVEMKDLPLDSELRAYSGCKDNISVIEMGAGHRLILKNGEILVPKSLRTQMLENLHVTHSSDSYMMLQAKGKICWPNMKADIRQYYKNCPECLEFKKSKAQRDTEVSYENLFENFLPGQQVQCDFAEFGGQDYHLIADEISGFLKVTKTRNKSTKEALRSLKE